METRQLKNIAILILLLLNCFLLLLLGYQRFQARKTMEETALQLERLFSAQDLQLSDQVDLQTPPLSPLALVRHESTETEMARYLLGTDASAASQGGGIVRYDSAGGALHFRSGGSFDGSGLSIPVEDPADFASQFCQSFGYQDLVAQLSDSGTGSVSATQYVYGVPVYGCGLTLSFSRGTLTAVSGTHVGLDDAAVIERDQLDRVTALVRFLDYRSSAGIVCSRADAIHCIYQLQSAPGSLRLIPLWLVETDTYPYIVDCASGAVSRVDPVHTQILPTSP